MKKIKFNELQALEYQILENVAAFCKSREIRYYLAGGTLLGAIRHEGFIPWDDDIDIIMPRPDYEQFLKLYNINNNNELKVLSPYDNYKFTFAKVFNTKTIKIEKGIKYVNGDYGGVDIDIFPIDGLPDDLKKSDEIFKQQKHLFRLYSSAISESNNRSLLGKCSQIPCKIIGAKRIIKKINLVAAKTRYEDANFIGVSVVPYYGNKERVSKQGFEKVIKVKFVNANFNAPSNYDEYLSNLYGSYMDLPPKEKRITHHDNQVYWK